MMLALPILCWPCRKKYQPGCLTGTVPATHTLTHQTPSTSSEWLCQWAGSESTCCCCGPLTAEPKISVTVKQHKAAQGVGGCLCPLPGGPAFGCLSGESGRWRKRWEPTCSSLRSRDMGARLCLSSHVWPWALWRRCPDVNLLGQTGCEEGGRMKAREEAKLTVQNFCMRHLWLKNWERNTNHRFIFACSQRADKRKQT